METLQDMVDDLRDRLAAAEAKIEDLIRPAVVNLPPNPPDPETKVSNAGATKGSVGASAPPFTPPIAPPSSPAVDGETKDQPTGV